MAETLFDRMGEQARKDRRAASDFRRVLALIALTPLTPEEPNFAGIGGGEAERFVRMAREILAAHPEV